MIVSRQDAKRIASGRKMQLRLERHRRAPAPGVAVPVTYYEPVEFSHRTIPVRACYIRVLERWATRVYAITESEAEAEGHRDRDEFLDVWGRKDREITAIRFELDPEHRPRLLTSRIVAGKQGAYVDSPVRAMPDEPEAVDPFTQARITTLAKARDRERERRRRQKRAELPFEEQLEELVREARDRHVDIRSELRAIGRWKNPDVQMQQLRIIRRKLEFPVALVA